MVFYVKLTPQATANAKVVVAIPERDLIAVGEKLRTSATPLLRLATFKAALRESVSEAQLLQLCELLVFMGLHQRRRNGSAVDVWDGLRLGLEDDGWTKEELDLWDSHKESVTTILASLNFVSLIKAIDLSVEHENNFNSVRVITDARCIFDDDTKKPVGTIVINTLLLSFIKDNSVNTIAIALDQSDLKELRDTCKRALKKSETLISVIEDGTLPTTIAGSGQVYDAN